MQWSRELRAAGRGLRTALRAASAIAKSQLNVPRTPPARKRVAASPGAAPPVTVRPLGGGLAAWSGFGNNPGRLAMLVYTPARTPPPGTPLVVLLHGCGQSAAEYAADAGWIALADSLGVPLVLPEQSDANNRGRCFNWFRPLAVKRGAGEGQSIRQMARVAIRAFDADPQRVFLAGLSAGGAMTAALLAAYPDVFAAGAVVAGLPVGSATGAAQALARMARAGPKRTPADWAAVARLAAPEDYAGPWPRISIWHGSADVTVDPANGQLLAAQWASLHGLDQTAPADTAHVAATHQSWGSAEQPAVELWTLAGRGHAWPGEATPRIARFWGITPD